MEDVVPSPLSPKKRGVRFVVRTTPCFWKSDLREWFSGCCRLSGYLWRIIDSLTRFCVYRPGPVSSSSGSFCKLLDFSWCLIGHLFLFHHHFLHLCFGVCRTANSLCEAPCVVCYNSGLVLWGSLGRLCFCWRSPALGAGFRRHGGVFIVSTSLSCLQLFEAPQISSKDKE